MQLQSFLENSARRLPAKEALICGGQRWTYFQLNDAAERVARNLRARGIARGHRVALFLQDSAETVVSIFAVLKAGGVFVPVSPGVKADKLRFMLENCEVSGVITDSVRLPLVQGVLEERPSVPVWVADTAAFEERASDAEVARQEGIDLDLAALVYTSGSRGRPKGVMLTHHNMVATATSISRYLENVESDVILNVLPLSFGYGLYQILTAFQVGATVVLDKISAYPQPILDALNRERATGFAMVPTVAAILLSLDLRQCSVPALRYLTNAGAAIPVEHIRRFRSAWPDVRFYSMYGLTECQRASYMPPEEIDARPGSVGRGMPNVEVYLVDDGGVRLPHGSTGELVVRGSNVMQGYWRDPEETAKALRPGANAWERVLYTGDLFRSDEDGYLYFLGRRDEMIKTRGEKVSPKEVEDVLCQLEQVAQVAVIGVPHPVLGHSIRALICLHPGAELTREQVIRHCAERLEDFMVPRQVEFRQELPVTPNGKVLRRALIENEVSL